MICTYIRCKVKVNSCLQYNKTADDKLSCCLSSGLTVFICNLFRFSSCLSHDRKNSMSWCRSLHDFSRHCFMRVMKCKNVEGGEQSDTSETSSEVTGSVPAVANDMSLKVSLGWLLLSHRFWAAPVPAQSTVVSVCRMDWAREFLGHWAEFSVPFRLTDMACSL